MLKVRKRCRSGYVKEVGGYTAWTEWQLVYGRKVIGRYDLESQAEAAKERLSVEQTAPVSRED